MYFGPDFAIYFPKFATTKTQLMKKLKLLFTTTALILFASTTYTASAQNFEGVITYKITYENMSEAMAQYESMFPKEQVTKIKGNKTKVEQKGGMGGSTTTIVDGKKGTTTIMMEQMGEKKYYVKENNEEEGEKPEIKYFDDDTKEIAGYECKRGEINIGEDQPPFIFYYTEEIQAPKIENKYKGMKGFMMEYEIETPQFTMILSADEVKEEKVSKGEFKIPSDYVEMTDDEIEALKKQAKSQK